MYLCLKEENMQDIQETLIERGKRYGEFNGHAIITQSLKDTIRLHSEIQNKYLPHYQKEALDMICHKIGRIINGDSDYIDSWVDIVGYAQLVVNELEKNNG